MAHEEQRDFCRRMLSMRDFSWVKRVLDIGSRDINGNNRWMFPGAEYVGIDIRPGPNVDIVADGAVFSPRNTLFDAVICTEVFEHCQRWREILYNGLGLLACPGIMLVTCAGPGRKEHGTPSSEPESNPGELSGYYQNISAREMIDAIPYAPFSIQFFESDNKCFDTRFFGVFE